MNGKKEDIPYRTDFRKFDETDKSLMNLPAFNHLCYFNLCKVSYSDKTLNQLREDAASSGTFVRYYHRFRKLSRWKTDLGFEVNRTLLKVLIEGMELRFKRIRLAKSIWGLRYEMNLNRKKVYRYLVERDGEVCSNCTATELLEIDHIVPVSKGGGNNYKNLQLLCRQCNRIKSNK